MLVAMARRVSLATKMRNHSDAVFAEMLEAALYTALIEAFSRYCRVCRARCGVLEEEKDALAYLKVAHALLGVMALLIRQLRTDLKTAACALCGACRAAAYVAH